MITYTRSRMVSLATAALLAGCGRSDPAPETAAHESTATAQTTSEHAGHMMSDSRSLEGAGPWTVTSSNGSHVTLSSPSAPFAAGQIQLDFSVHSDDPDERVHSVDLISPAMPMHGLVRLPVTEGVAEFEIPMEGQWAIYANLNAEGTNSAEFFFDVAPGTGPNSTHNDGG